MADKTISSLTPASSVGSSDLFVLEQNSTAKSLSGSVLVTHLLSMIDGHGGITSITWTNSGTPGNGASHVCTITLADGTVSSVTINDGLKGDTGKKTYVWVRYASRNPVSDADIGTSPDAWMGIYSGESSAAPSTYQSYSWYQIKGNTGPGATLVSRTVQYQESTSPINATGTWQDTVPTVAPGNYLWTHITITFDSGSPVDWYEVARQGTNGVDGIGAVSTVNGIGPDSNNNVEITASDIYYGNQTVADALDTLTGSITTTQNQITAQGILKGAGSGVVSSATKGTDYGAKSFTITLAANSWSSNAQTITNSDFVTSGYVYTVSPASSSREAYINANIYADDVAVASKMTFHCESAPASNLTVNVMRVVSA